MSEVLGCGSNGQGQLGLGGQRLGSGRPRQIVSLHEIGVDQLACGKSHSLALTADGDVYSWGEPTAYHVPQLMQMERRRRFVRIVAAAGYSLALDDTGQLWGWGPNKIGELNPGDTVARERPVRVADGIARMAAGGGHVLASTHAGETLAWGLNGHGQCATDELLAPLRHARGLCGGVAHSAALLDDGSVWAWGAGGRGELCTADGRDRTRPVRLTSVDRLGRVRAIACGTHSTLFLDDRGGVHRCGDGQGLGDDATAPTRVPTPAGVRVSAIVASPSAGHSLLLGTAGEMIVWGRDVSGQAGLGKSRDWVAVRVPTDAHAPPAAAACVGLSHTLLACRGNCRSAVGATRGTPPQNATARVAERPAGRAAAQKKTAEEALADAREGARQNARQALQPAGDYKLFK